MLAFKAKLAIKKTKIIGDTLLPKCWPPKFEEYLRGRQNKSNK